MAASSRIVVLTKSTSVGEWTISTATETFEVSAITHGFPYYMTISSVTDFECVSENIHSHVRAVANHCTGLSSWDASSEPATDYIKDWTLNLDKKFQMRLMTVYLSTNASLREMVDYFEHKYGYFMDRSLIKELLEELIMTRQIENLPNMSRAPAEFRSLERMAKVWLDEGET